MASDHVTAHACVQKIHHSFIVLHLIENALAPAEKRLNVSTKFQTVAIVRLSDGQANSPSEFVKSSNGQPDVRGNFGSNHSICPWLKSNQSSRKRAVWGDGR
jgi:hypothetical protein